VLVVARGLPEGQLDGSKLFDEVERELADELAYFSRVLRGEREPQCTATRKAGYRQTASTQKGMERRLLRWRGCS